MYSSIYCTLPSLESTKGAILPELVELANDEESSVRLAGLDAVVSILGLLDDGKCHMCHMCSCQRL